MRLTDNSENSHVEVQKSCRGVFIEKITFGSSQGIVCLLTKLNLSYKGTNKEFSEKVVYFSTFLSTLHINMNMLTPSTLTIQLALLNIRSILNVSFLIND